MTDDLAAFLDAAEARLGSAEHDWDGYFPDLVALVAMVRAVLALCDEITSSPPYGYNLRHTDVRAALLAAIPPTPTAEETR